MAEAIREFIDAFSDVFSPLMDMQDQLGRMILDAITPAGPAPLPTIKPSAPWNSAMYPRNQAGQFKRAHVAAFQPYTAPNLSPTTGAMNRPSPQFAPPGVQTALAPKTMAAIPQQAATGAMFTQPKAAAAARGGTAATGSPMANAQMKTISDIKDLLEDILEAITEDRKGSREVKDRKRKEEPGISMVDVLKNVAALAAGS